MHRRSATRRKSQAGRPVTAPTPASSAYATPASSALPSAYAPEAEADIDDEMARLPINALTLDVPIANAPKPKRTKQKPFRFLDLPYELRLEVYGYHFINTGEILDLDPDNYKRIHQKLAILRTCRTIYREASYLFYSTHPARIFPTHPGRFFNTKKPLLARLKPGQRGTLTSLELRLGPGWSKPPRGWVVKPELGLKDCVSVKKITVFVECDPGNDIFKGFRRAEGFYEGFSKSLLEKVLDEMPWVDYIEFDAWPSVKKSGALMRGLLEVVASRGLKRGWGSERGWTDAEEVEEPHKPLDLNAPILTTAQLHILLLHGASIEAVA
ncbi:hypothetical protein DL771_001242 [Monosporascus sp. 5C6A]|nr:hypothetical protein DL771_001242 [Monosporascus sp. 5C6A]